ncbi:hypothetical protein CPB85DRAFT_1263968, partial [Mucidula mucida]
MSVRDDISTSSLPSPSLDPSRFGSPSILFDVSKLLPEEKSVERERTISAAGDIFDLQHSLTEPTNVALDSHSSTILNQSPNRTTSRRTKSLALRNGAQTKARKVPRKSLRDVTNNIPDVLQTRIEVFQKMVHNPHSLYNQHLVRTSLTTPDTKNIRFLIDTFKGIIEDIDALNWRDEQLKTSFEEFSEGVAKLENLWKLSCPGDVEPGWDALRALEEGLRPRLRLTGFEPLSSLAEGQIVDKTVDALTVKEGALLKPFTLPNLRHVHIVRKDSPAGHICIQRPSPSEAQLSSDV